MDDVARENRLTAIFSENTVNSDEENYIQIIIFTKANHSGKTRRRNFGVVKINPSDILDLSGDVATAGELANTPISFTWDDFQKVEGYEHGYVSGRDKTAWYVSNLSVTFHVDSGVNPDTFPQDEETQTILATVEPRVRINENNFDIDFTKINLLQESTTYATSYGSFWKRNFTPFSEVTINNRLDKNLQGFKTNDLDRQICSSPTNISLKVDVAKYEQYSNNDSVIIQRAYAAPNGGNIPPHYKVCVVHWNDINDEFTTVEDVFDKKPTNFDEVIEAQDNNTFIFKDYSETFNHNYTTPGIKKIKILIFSYIPFGQETWNNNYKNSEMPPFDRIEPIRYKLLTSRIFLDIPISQFEDFFELGGTEYRTIPWPYTTPVIGGVSQDSKYLKSIDDILGGGKIGDTDIIDERFLLEAKENDELGKNIESMDLEQCRYFDKNYSMYDLLDIPLMVDYEYYSGVFPIPTLEDGSDVWDYDSDDLILEYNTELTEYTAQCNDSFGNSGRGEEFSTTIEGLYNHIECTNNGTCQSAMDVMDLSQWFKFKFTYMGTEVGSEDENETIGAVGLRFEMGGPSDFPGKKHRIHADDWDRESGPNGEPPSPYFGTEIAYQMTNGEITFRIYDSGGQPRDDFFEKANCTIGEECVIWIQLQPSFDGVEPTQHTITLHNGKNFNKTKWKNMSLERADLIGEQMESGFMPYDNFNYWNGSSPQQSYSDDISIGQIFINDNSDLDLKQSCKLELNTGELTGKSIYDSSGNSNKGMLIGDYKIKKTAKGQTMRRDSFIKVPKKANNSDGAL